MDTGRERAILDYAHSAFVSMDEDGRIAFWNIRAEEIFGHPREHVVGRLLADTIVPERHREAHSQGVRRFLRTGEGPILNRRVELSAIRADGGEFPVELTVSALAEGNGWSFHAFIADISERVAAERERQRLLEELQLALRGSEQRLDVVVNALAEAVTIRGLDNHLIYANRAALERLGFDSIEALRSADPRELMDPYGTWAEDGTPLRMEDLPSVHALGGEDPEPLTMRVINRSTGEEQWVVLKANAIRDASGATEAAVTIIEDVTASMRAAQRMEFLAHASRLLASSLDYQQTLGNVAGLAVPRVADWCAVDLFDERGRREPVAVAHSDPSKLAMAERLREYEPDTLDPERGLGRVRASGETILYNELPDELLEAAAVDGEHLRLLREVGMRAVLLVPMTVRGRTIGALSLISAESGRLFDGGDVELAEQIAEVAALAVDNARMYSERSSVAHTLQSSLLPKALPDLPGWEIAALYRPAGHETEVGGDFYDLWEAGGEWMMMIGDVTGKGVAAAAVTSLVRHTAWTAADFDTRPARVLERIDAALKRRPELSVCTALCVRIRGERGTLASGGHPLIMHVGAAGVRELGSAGTLLGAFPRTRWPESSFAMRDGDTLVAITDGVTDTVGAGFERFGVTRLQELLHGAQNENPMTIRERVAEALEEFQVGPQADDTAIVIMRFNGAVGSSGGLSGVTTAAGRV